MDQKQLQDSIERELKEHLLPFWRERSLDHRDDGFVAEMANDGTVNTNAPKGLILNARLLWTFSALYHEFSNERDLALARRAFHYLEKFFHDKECGGYVWHVGQNGAALDSSKKIYGQAFCIYALSEYYGATRESAAIDHAKELFQLIEHHAYDDLHGGYIEVLAKDWSPAEDLRLSHKDMDVAKSMNNHLHLLEAYANLYRIWPNPKVALRLSELIQLFGSKIFSKEGHFNLFFDADWTLRSNSYTYGHDIEGAWLLYDAAEALDDPKLVEQSCLWIETIARAVSGEALDEEGGMVYEGHNGIVINSGREWWPQAEAMLGFWYAYRITGTRHYYEIVVHLWEFIQKRMVNRTHGEWFWRVFPDGAIDPTEPKISEWKDPYHAVRMCLRMLRFLET
jgi:cellobiose epimerase